MTEKTRTPYVLLKCGHYTTWESIEASRLWQQKKDRFFCEVCGKWIDKAAKKKIVYPPEPLF